jgi:hypothetical protein
MHFSSSNGDIPQPELLMATKSTQITGHVHTGLVTYRPVTCVSMSTFLNNINNLSILLFWANVLFQNTLMTNYYHITISSTFFCNAHSYFGCYGYLFHYMILCLLYYQSIIKFVF